MVVRANVARMNSRVSGWTRSCSKRSPPHKTASTPSASASSTMRTRVSRRFRRRRAAATGPAHANGASRWRSAKWSNFTGPEPNRGRDSSVVANRARRDPGRTPRRTNAPVPVAPPDRRQVTTVDRRGRVSTPSGSSDGASPGEELEEQYDRRNDQQQVDQPAADVADQPQQPQHQDDHQDGPEHGVVLLSSSVVMHGTWRASQAVRLARPGNAYSPSGAADERRAR